MRRAPGAARRGAGAGGRQSLRDLDGGQDVGQHLVGGQAFEIRFRLQDEAMTEHRQARRAFTSSGSR